MAFNLNAFLANLLPAKEAGVVVLSVQAGVLEAALYSPSQQRILRTHVQAFPSNTFSNGLDTLNTPANFSQAVEETLQQLEVQGSMPCVLCVPCVISRIVELPKMELEEYHQSLVGELERYRAFEGTEASIAFAPIPGAALPSQQKLLAVSCRNDTLQQYCTLLKEQKLQVKAVYTHPFSIVNGFLKSAAFESIEAQASDASFSWGSLMQDGDRFRILLWKNEQLLDVREITLSGQLMQNANYGDLILQDTLVEIKRTLKHFNQQRPAFWVTSKLSWNSCRYFSEQLNVPVQPFELDNEIQAEQSELGLSLIGGCLSYHRDSLFQLDLLAHGLGSNEGEGASWQSFLQVDLPNLGQFYRQVVWVLLLNCLFLGGSWLVLSLWALHNNELLKNFKADNLNTQSDLVVLNKEIKQEKSQLALYQSIWNNYQQGLRYNQCLDAFLGDLQQQLPPHTWIESIQLKENTLTLKGYSLNTTGLGVLTQRLQKLPSVHSVALQGFNAQSLEGETVFEFEFDGLLDAPSATMVSDTHFKEAGGAKKEAASSPLPPSKDADDVAPSADAGEVIRQTPLNEGEI